MKKIVVIASSLISAAAFAQTATPQTENAGLLGKRYAEASFGWVDVNHSSSDAMAVGVDFNVPVHTNFDLGIGYAYSWLEGGTNLGSVLGADITGYYEYQSFKPFASLGLSQVWANRNIDGNQYVAWDVSAGVEHTVTDCVSLGVSISYADAFRSGDNHTWSGDIVASVKLTDKLLGTAGISYIEGGSFGYTVSLIQRF
jgi:opacity protein-like surface antigen